MSRQYVTRSEMVEIIKSVKGCTAISIVAETPVDLKSKAKNAPFFGTTKINRIAGLIGFDYETSVNNQLGREDKEMEFKAQAHKWARATDSYNLKTNEARDKLYLWLKVQSSGSPKFFYAGNEVDKETIEPFIRPHTAPNTQANVEKKITPRTFDINNILIIKMLGKEYRISENVVRAEKVATEMLEEIEA